MYAVQVCVAFKPQTACHCPSTALLTNASVVIYPSPGTFEISTAQEGFQDLMGPSRHGPPQCVCVFSSKVGIGRNGPPTPKPRIGATPSKSLASSDVNAQRGGWG
jgi:hypothetical protein